jgi:phosphate transport system permease protein
VVLVGLVLLVADVTMDGWRLLSPRFLTAPSSRFGGDAGVGPALAGTALLGLVTVAVAWPVGVGAALYFEEYAPRGPLRRLIQSSMTNLAGVPSVIYGLIGLAVFVRWLGMGHSVLAAGLTLAGLAIPTMYLTATEAIRGVSPALREAAFGLGATRWQVVRFHVLPDAMPGIISGSVLAFSRTVGETAPLLVLGAASFITFAPTSLADPIAALPTQIYSWIARPEEEFRAPAAGAIIVLLAMLVAMNALAALLRRRFGART